MNNVSTGSMSCEYSSDFTDYLHPVINEWTLNDHKEIQTDLPVYIQFFLTKKRLYGVPCIFW